MSDTTNNQHTENVTEALRLLNEADEPKYRAPADPSITDVDEMYDLAELAHSGASLDGSDPAADNVRRAAFAAQAVIAYSDVTGNRDLDTVISDLTGDMQHLLDVLSEWNDGEGLGSIDYLVENGTRHYEAEIRGEF